MLLALPYPTMTFLPFYVAEDLGFFSREGLRLHCIHVREEKGQQARLALKRIPNLGPEEAEGNYEIIQKFGGYSCAITEEGIRYMSEVLGLVKGSARKVSLKDVADLTFLERAQAELSL